MEGKAIDGKTNHFIAAAEKLPNNEIAFAYLDVSTGEANASIVEGGAKELYSTITSLNIREVIVTQELQLELADYGRNNRHRFIA